MKNTKVAFQSDGTIETGKLIINYLVELGGINEDLFNGNSKNWHYFIDINNVINQNYSLPKKYKLLSNDILKETVQEPDLKVAIRGDGTEKGAGIIRSYFNSLNLDTNTQSFCYDYYYFPMSENKVASSTNHPLGYKTLTIADITPKKRMPKIAVNSETFEGIDVIKFLESIGGVNKYKIGLYDNYYYYIVDNYISSCPILPEGYELLKY